MLRQQGFAADVLTIIEDELDAAFLRARSTLEQKTEWNSSDISFPRADTTHSAWQDWDPNTYLRTFFAELGPDTFATLQFLAHELQCFRDNPVERALDFGCGPTPIVSIAAAPYVREIHLADYLSANLKEVQRWLDADPSAFSWDHAIAEILKLEGTEPTRKNIAQRAAELRGKASTQLCDASLQHPLHGQKQSYPLVLSMFCADSATSSKETWRQYMRNISTLVAPSGRILIAALRQCRAYHLGERTFPAANVDENDLESVLIEAGFLRVSLDIRVCDVPECIEEGFSSVMFARAIKGN
jgi:hypothetical protein